MIFSQKIYDSTIDIVGCGVYNICIYLYDGVYLFTLKVIFTYILNKTAKQLKFIQR